MTLGGRYRALPAPVAFLLQRVVRPVVHRALRGVTLGVQAVVRNDAGHVLLIRQSYTPYWVFPGGGVDGGEPVAKAAVRELREETNVEVRGDPQLFGVYSNFQNLPGDHVCLFTVPDWHLDHFPEPNREIIDHQFFPVDGLPGATAGGVRRRLAEISGETPISPEW